MKPSVKLVRYLAALALLTLGVVLSGCGGLLGAVNGEFRPTVQVVGSATRSVVPGGSVDVVVEAPAGATGVRASQEDPNDVIASVTQLAVLGATRQVRRTFRIQTNVRTGTGVVVFEALDAQNGVLGTAARVTIVVEHPQGHAQGGGGGA